MHDGIKVDEDRGIMQVDSYGTSSKQDIADSISEIKQVYADRGFHKVLVDTTRQEAMPGIVDIFEVFSTFPRELKLALLLKRKQRTEEDLYFGEDVGVNRGVLMKIFYDREQAIEWLDNG